MELTHQTYEIALQYEKQGHYEDALKTYQFLKSTAIEKKDSQEKISQLEQAIQRIRELIQQKGDGPPVISRSDRIARLCEKWIRLMILKHRFTNYLIIKSRL